jgi:predicted RNA-binding Zn-ribbon protein involved in translation (DUF1610 family)
LTEEKEKGKIMSKIEKTDLLCPSCELIIPKEIQNKELDCPNCGDELCTDNGDYRNLGFTKLKKA